MRDTESLLRERLTRHVASFVKAKAMDARKAMGGVVGDIVSRTIHGRRIDGPGFNVPTTAAMKTLSANPSVVALHHRRLKLGQDGHLTVGVAWPETYRRFGSDGQPSEELVGWTSRTTHIKSDKGKVSVGIWTFPAMFASSLMEESTMEGKETEGRWLTSAMRTSLPLLAAYRSACVEPDGFRPSVVILPVDGNVMMGSFEVVDCLAMKKRARSVLDGGRQVGLPSPSIQTMHGDPVVHTIVSSAVVHSTKSVLSLTMEQKDAVRNLNAWMMEHSSAMEADPLACNSWRDEYGDTPLPRDAGRSFEAVNRQVQDAFGPMLPDLSASRGVVLDHRPLIRDHLLDKSAALRFRTAPPSMAMNA